MSEVLIDDSSLNAIAHSIRRKNGLLRTYKPREMAPAIRAFNDFVPDAHSFTVTVQQSPHQTIRVRKYLDADYKEYTNTFTVSEPFYKADIIVEADAGYEAGKPNYVSPITIDRDMVISASPATEIPPENYTTLYMNGTNQGYYQTYFYSDPSCSSASRVDRGSIYGILNAIDVSHNFTQTSQQIYRGTRLFGGDGSYEGGFQYVTQIIQNIDVSEKRTLDRAFAHCGFLSTVDVTNFDTRNCEDFSDFFNGCGRLLHVDVTGFDLGQARYLNHFFNGCSYIESIDFAHSDTPYVLTVEGIFAGCSNLKYLDISYLNLDNCTNMNGEFTSCPSLKYVIVDSQTLRKKHSFGSLPSSTKILVPENMITQYREEYTNVDPNKFVDINNYTIARYGGQVWVTPNN